MKITINSDELNEINADFPIDEDVRQILKNQLKNKLKNDLKNELVQEIRNELFNELSSKQIESLPIGLNSRYANESSDYHTPKTLTHNSILYVISVVSNPARFKRRYQLFNEYCERMKLESKVKLVTVELQQGSRPFETNATIKLRTDDELWYKENMINIAVRHLPTDWEYMAWIDADVEFVNRNWAEETIQKLQTHEVVQLFSHIVDMGLNKETLQVYTGFGYHYCQGEVYNYKGRYGGNYWHSGIAAAITRKAYDGIGGLLDFAILGSADNHMILSFIGLVNKSIVNGMHPNYKMLCENFQERCERHIKRNLGFVHGTVLHHYHGNKGDRKYVDRWQVLIKNKFDPLRDISKNSDGLWVLNEEKIQLRDEIRRYFRERNEDVVKMTDTRYYKSNWI